MKNKKRRFWGKHMGIIFFVLLLFMSIAVSAEVFSAGEAVEVTDIFSSGFGDGEGSPVVPGDSVIVQPEEENTQTEIEIPQVQPEDMQPAPETGEEVIIEFEGTDIFQDENTEPETDSSEDSLTIFGEGEHTMTANTNLKIVFKGSDGSEYTELLLNKKMGDTITFPMVPGRENATGCGWKLDLAGADDAVPVWYVNDQLTLAENNLYVTEKIKNGVLTFYAVPGTDPCVVMFYNNGGTGYFQRKEVKAGTEIVLPNFIRSNFQNLGWTMKKGSAVVQHQFGETYKIEQDTNFYIVRYNVRTATFRGQKGGSNAQFSVLKQTVKKNATIVLPEVPKVTGYQSLGWASKVNSTTAQYKEGEKVKLTDNKTFYAVYKFVGKCTVKFTNNGGTTTSKSFTSLNFTTTKNSYVILPEVPKMSGYMCLGWTDIKNGSTAKYGVGEEVQIKKNTTFYAVRKASCKVYLRTKGGSSWNTVEVLKNSYYTLPGVTNKNGYTMMGWSTKKGQSKAPQYEVGEKIKITKNTTLYSVLYVRKNETDYSGLQLQQVTDGLLSNYKQVIFVGDSRTNRMSLTLKTSGYSASSDNISFISKEGGGLSWLKSTGYSTLLNKVGNNTSLRGKKTAVIFNLGVNDLNNSAQYVTYMKSIAPVLEKRGCELYYMSVNPVNNKSITYWGKKSRTEASVRSFNSTIKSKLCGSSGDYTYIDTYAYLLKYGYGTNSGTAGYDIDKDDGLHYTVKTYKRIFRYCINILKK